MPTTQAYINPTNTTQFAKDYKFSTIETHYLPGGAIYQKVNRIVEAMLDSAIFSGI